MPAHLFETYFLTQNGTDLQFYGIKKKKEKVNIYQQLMNNDRAKIK